MSDLSEIIRVFISSPNGLGQERDSIDDAIDEVNRTLGQSKRVCFQSIRWEKDIHSGISDEPQSVIIEQIDEKYDVFIGLMGARFGTPTSKYGSGTEEEFENALKSHRMGRKIHIMFYFKSEEINTGSVKLDEIAQLQKVIEFKKKLSDSGVLYHEFDKASELSGMTRRALASILMGKNQPAESPQKSTQSNINISKEGAVSSENSERSLTLSDVDDGILDQIERATIAREQLIQSLENINKFIAKLNDMIEDYNNTVKITTRKNLDIAESRMIFNGFAEPLTLLSEEFSNETPSFKNSSTFFVENYFNAANSAMLLNLSTSEERETLLNEIKILHQPINKALEKMKSLMESIEQLPGMTREINLAKSNSWETLKELYFELMNSNMTLESAIGIMEEEPTKLDSFKIN